MRPGVISFHINAAVLPDREDREGFSPKSYYCLPRLSLSPALRIGGWIVLAGLEWIVGLGGVGGYVRIEKGRFSPSYSLVPSPSLSRYPLLPRLPRKVIGRLFATLSGTKWAALPVDCCYLSSDKET